MRFVLVGGMWLDASAWDGVVAALNRCGHTAAAVALPGQGDGNRAATMDDQITAVLAAVDAGDEPSVVVGHSAACTLAWLAADRRSERVAAVALVGGFPSSPGAAYAPFFPPVGDEVPFPGWDAFDVECTVDLDTAARMRLAAAAIPLPAAVATAAVHYHDPRRFDIPVRVICPEFSAADARVWVDGGEVPELAAAARLSYADIDSGHWPMFTRPAELAEIIARPVESAETSP